MRDELRFLAGLKNATLRLCVFARNKNHPTNQQRLFFTTPLVKF
jgi:hypothetical protein